MLHVVCLDLGSSTHHQGAAHNGSALALMLVFEGSILLEEFVTDSGVKPSSDFGDETAEELCMFLSFIELSRLLRSNHVGLIDHEIEIKLLRTIAESYSDGGDNVKILVALEKT
ncbi:hypothetical protein CTAM01_11860 [Colletotrichum tamarilloi]|uniref:Uncharacterized protein n=1 Tax=Colletotrichum tamarilloi TaxID=1209934 RepID=A0ABQ9QWL3_9PEZI|nr:uncharacterized protein CTAM01_11860 [Colletotrichum tamarilloi]KAK1487403.1 hypothetical protein CTAM01_11860 [Colletotrichum tamarilloi]